MINSGTVWQIPVMPPPKHTVLAATTTASATTTLASTTMQDVERIHEVLCCAGATTMLLYYKHYHGTGFGKASTAAVRNSRCPIKALMQGDANPKRRRTQDAQTESTPPPPPADTTDVHAHAAHSDAEDNVCACVQISRRNASNSRPQNYALHFVVQHPSHQPSIVGRVWLRGSVQQERLHNHQLRGSKLRGSKLRGSKPRGSKPQSANMDRNARSLQRHVPQGGRHHQKSCGAAR